MLDDVTICSKINQTRNSTKINKPGVNLAGAAKDSPKTEGLLSVTLIPGLVLEANGAQRRRFAGICDIDSQSKFLFRVAHAIFFFTPSDRPPKYKYLVSPRSSYT